MRLSISRRAAWTAAGVLVAVTAAVVGTAEAARKKTDPRVFNVHGKAYGKSFKDWTVEWWQWIESIPVSVNPLFDETGASVEVGQRGPVWFLVGVTNGSGVATRTATIPSGKALFFPLINVINFNFGDPPYDSIESMRTFQAQYIAAIGLDSLHVTLDGSEIQGVDGGRVVTPQFTLALPADSPFAASGVPRGVWGWATADGYWCMLKPLAVGTHTLHFQATAGAPENFSLDITYDLDVVDHDKP